MGKIGASECAEVIERYRSIASGLGLPAEAIEPIARNLTERLEKSTTDANLYMDTMKAGGEDNCARLIAQALQARGVEAHYVSPKDAGLILSDEPGNAQVLPEAYNRLRDLHEKTRHHYLSRFSSVIRKRETSSLFRVVVQTSRALFSPVLFVPRFMRILPMLIPCSRRTHLSLKNRHRLPS